jgi:aspartokinase
MTVTDKLYSTLGPAQRVVAVVSAMARRDDPETTRLMQTAPLATYRAHDLEFWRLLHCAERMALHAALLIEPEVIRYVAHLGILVHMTSGDECGPEVFDRLTESIAEISASIRAYWLAYSETCASIGIDPDELLRGVGVELSSHARVLTAKDTEPDPELLASATTLMRQLAGR